MLKRIFSRETYNGYHLVTIKGEGGNSPIGFFKKSQGKDESGNLALENDFPLCPHAGKVNTIVRPWGEFIYVPSLCQRCKWLYSRPDSQYDCLLKTRAHIRVNALVCGGP